MGLLDFKRNSRFAEDNQNGGQSGSWFDLQQPVGWDHPNAPEDVIKVETVIGNAGHFDLQRQDGPTGYLGRVLDEGIRAFQKKNGLEVDGTLNPGGPTITAARQQLAGRLEGFRPPTPDQVEEHHRLRKHGGEGLLTIYPPIPTLRPIPDLPEVSADEYVMNRRSTDYLRQNDVDGEHSRWTALDVMDRGPAGVARARDLIGQLREHDPKRADSYATALLSHLPDAQHQRAFLGGDPPTPRPLGILAAEAPERQADSSPEKTTPTPTPAPQEEKPENPPASEQEQEQPASTSGGGETQQDKQEPSPADQAVPPAQTHSKNGTNNGEDNQQLAQGDETLRDRDKNANKPAKGEFDRDKFGDTLAKNAGVAPGRKCATHVRQALEAGGVNTDGHPRDAKDWGPTLEKSGFTPVDKNGYVPQKGDVAVIQPHPGGNESGHMAGYNGKQWISDAPQHDMWGGQGYRSQQPPYVVYRRSP